METTKPLAIRPSSAPLWTGIFAGPFAFAMAFETQYAVIGWIWMNLYGLFVTRLREVITAPRVRQWMQRITGVVLLGFGARLALERV